MASIWPSGDITDGQKEVKITMSIIQFIDLTVKKSASKSSAVSAQEGGILYWPACWMPIKENLGGPSLQSAASDQHRHTLHGHNLNYTIWILYAESVSFL
jgi:hypothetical protein